MNSEMNTQANAAPESPLDPQAIASAGAPAIRPMYWSVRRELWENRSIYIAPLIAAGVYLLGYLISLIALPHRMRAQAALDMAHQRVMLAMPYTHAAMLLMLTAFLVGIFYSLDALHGERRDRSILFWKSLPVSDLTTVVSKACIPLVVLPLITFALTVATEVIMVLMNTLVLVLSGQGAGTLLSELPFFQMELVLLYTVIVVALWHAPMYAWFLLVSGWARRTVFLWGVLPLLAIGALEMIAFHTFHFINLLRYRVVGFALNAYSFTTPDGQQVDEHLIPLTQLTPGRFLSSPGLWAGLAVAAVLLAAAVRLRRYREPI